MKKSQRDSQRVRVYLNGSYRWVQFYRRTDSESTAWYVCVYVKEEDRQFRRSLGTPDFKEAQLKAHKLLEDTFFQIRSGGRLFAPSLREVYSEWCAAQELLVRQEQIAPTTLRQLINFPRRGIEFLVQMNNLSWQSRITEVDGRVFGKYLDWRLANRDINQHKKGLTPKASAPRRKDVIHSELLRIRRFFVWAQERGYCTVETTPKWNFVVENDSAQRARIELADWNKVVKIVRRWADSAPNEREHYYRRMVQHVLLFMGYSGLRTGEVLGLQNRDVIAHRSDKTCIVKVRRTITKTRREREITVLPSPGGRLPDDDSNIINYLIRWIDNHQLHKKPTDLVFSLYEDGGRSARVAFYIRWRQLRKELAKEGVGHIDTYHARHWWITNRLYAGESIHLVARAAGTSVAMIERTYSHVVNIITTRNFKQVIYGKDGSVTAIEPPRKNIE